MPLRIGSAAAAGRGTTMPVTLGIRSEDIRVGPAEAVESRVHDVENHGVEKIVTLRVEEALLKATVPATMQIEVENPVRFSWNPDKVHCFDRHSGTNLAAAAA
jgi:multiple sugar transport system ATP-binding protein